MNTLFTFLLLSFVSFSTFAQNWAPVGAKWTYNLSDVNQIGTNLSYTSTPLHFIVSKDTIINGITSSKIISHSGTCWSNSNPAFMYENNDVVYLYSPSLNSFRPFYNFNLNIGGSYYMVYESSGTPDSIQIRIDSTKTVTINNVNFKSIYLRSLDNTKDVSFLGWVTERIGGSNTLFPFYITCDPYASGIRCYSDTGMTVNSDTRYPDCDSTYQWTNVGIKSSEISSIKIYPNPVVDDLLFNNPDPIDIEVYTLTGIRIIKQTVFPAKSLSLSSLASGTYLIKINSQRTVSTQRINKF